MISGLTKLCAVYRVGRPKFLSRFGQPPVSSGRVVHPPHTPHPTQPHQPSTAMRHSTPLRRPRGTFWSLGFARVRAPVGNVGAAAAPPQARTPATPPDGDRELEVLAGAGLCCFLGALLLCNVASAALMATRWGFGGRGSAAAAGAAEIFVVATWRMLMVVASWVF
ncbi:hypothetical protein PVAP13_6KG244700 [Panicum virgatum]|uniref:Uncharacterized protein n=1 Tax=Panicum virgatum TaxID=38727 RepID=A0A8T0RFH9_PANVG|nr:hypothetical protein PVAP13_6KG244700 [Panicum virgatum]